MVMVTTTMTEMKRGTGILGIITEKELYQHRPQTAWAEIHGLEMQALLLSNCTLRYVVLLAVAHMTCYRQVISKTSMANAGRSKWGPGAFCVGPRRSLSGPGALSVGAQRSLPGPGGLCVGAPGALCRGRCRGPAVLSSRSVCWARRSPRFGALCVRVLCALCRDPALLCVGARCRAPALCLSGPGAFCVLCRGPALSVSGCADLCRGPALSCPAPALCVGARRSLCRVGCRRSLRRSVSGPDRAPLLSRCVRVLVTQIGPQLRSARRSCVPPAPTRVPLIRPRPPATHPVSRAPSSDLRSACHPCCVVGVPGMSAGCSPPCHPQTMLRSRRRKHVQPLAGNADADTGQFHQGTSSPTVVCTRISPAATSLLLRTRLLCHLPSRATKTKRCPLE